MWTAAFWIASLERAIKTAAQTLLSLWLVGDLLFNLMAVNWGEALGVTAGAVVLSLLTSIVAGAADPGTGPSFGTEVPKAPGGAAQTVPPVT